MQWQHQFSRGFGMIFISRPFEIHLASASASSVVVCQRLIIFPTLTDMSLSL